MSLVVYNHTILDFLDNSCVPIVLVSMLENMANTIGVTIESPELTMLVNNKRGGYNFRERRHDDWNENYSLYRDKVELNRLIQRQSVNVPLMKQSVRTLLKDVDDMPLVQFEELGNNKDAEIFKNEYWKWTLDYNRMEIQDIVDKKQVFLFGRSFDQMQVVDGKVKMTIQDPMDILVSRYTDPTNIHTSRFLVHTHIFRPLSEIENNPMYDKEAIRQLKLWHGTNAGLVKSKSNADMAEDKNKKMEDLGLSDVNNPILGETIVELSLHFVFRREEGDTEDQIYLYVECDDMVILMKKKLEEVIGTTKDHWWKTHYPYNTWADDIERQDFWSDGVADIIRTPNKVLNSWFSQLVENRTLKNFGMNYYDATIEGFTPPSNQSPVPGGWYPLPGKPSEVYQKVDVPDLSDSLDEMQFIIGMAEKATGATATQQGVQTEKKITLGEVELALGEAKERIKGMSKFYTQAWKDRAVMFDKLLEAAESKLDAVKVYRKGKNTNDVYSREISPKDWTSKAGYSVKVWSQDERNEQNMKRIEKMSIAKNAMPDNPVVDSVNKRKILEYAEYSPEEIMQAMEFEQRKQEFMQQTQEQTMIQQQKQPIQALPIQSPMQK